MPASTVLLILKLIDLVALGASMAPAVLARVNAASDKIKEMVREDRDPTPEEFAELDRETNDLMAEILGAPQPE